MVGGKIMVDMMAVEPRVGAEVAVALVAAFGPAVKKVVRWV